MLNFFRWGNQSKSKPLENKKTIKETNATPQIIATDRSNRFCIVPFSQFRVAVSGDVSSCSRTSIPIIGNLLENSADEIWNSDRSKELRRSILDGTFEYCDARHCPALQKMSLPSRSGIQDVHYRNAIEKSDPHLSVGPRHLNLHFDRTCNLKCPSCRTELYIAKGKERAKAEKIFKRLVSSECLKSAEQATVCGNGEVFSSRVHMEFLKTFDQQRFPNLKIHILTNGLLLTPKVWESIVASHKAIEQITVSVDAASNETYLVNRGGDFDCLLSNLKFISSLRRNELISKFKLAFVVQKNNYKEMPLFVSLAKDLGVDLVLFQKLYNSDNANMSDFLDRAVHLPNHPEFENFKSILALDIMKEKIVDLYTVSGVQAE